MVGTYMILIVPYYKLMILFNFWSREIGTVPMGCSGSTLMLGTFEQHPMGPSIVSDCYSIKL